MEIERPSTGTVGAVTSPATIPFVSAYAVAVAFARDGDVGKFEAPARTAASAADWIRAQVPSKVEMSTAIATTPSRTGIRIVRITNICPRRADPEKICLRFARFRGAPRARSIGSGVRFDFQYAFTSHLDPHRRTFDSNGPTQHPGERLKCSAHARRLC